MTEPEYDRNLTGRDVRRAAALMVHHSRQDVAGLMAVIGEVRGDDDSGESTTRLVFGLLGLFNHLQPALATPLGLQLLSSAVLSLAEIEEGSKP